MMPLMPAQASTHAAEIDHVLGLEHWGMLALFVFFRVISSMCSSGFARARILPPATPG